MSVHTTQGLMTSADMADYRDLYDLNEGQAEEEAMEDAHAAHVEDCRACQEDASQRETTAKVALAMDTARRELEKAVQEALGVGVLQGPLALHRVRVLLEEGLEASRKALRSI